MSSTIQIKRSSANAAPGANTLHPGELAFSYVSNTLYIGDTSNGNIALISNVSVNVTPAYNQANLAYSAANTALAVAELAYAEANVALPVAGGTITGSLVVNQNLTVNGVVTLVIDGGSF